MADPLVSAHRPSNDGWSNAYTPSGTSSTHGALSPAAAAPPLSATGGYTRDPKIFGMPSASLTAPAAGAAHNGSSTPFIKIRIGGLERNRKDLLVRFDASVRVACGVMPGDAS